MCSGVAERGCWGLLYTYQYSLCRRSLTNDETDSAHWESLRSHRDLWLVQVYVIVSTSTTHFQCNVSSHKSASSLQASLIITSWVYTAKPGPLYFFDTPVRHTSVFPYHAFIIRVPFMPLWAAITWDHGWAALSSVLLFRATMSSWISESTELTF